ncbi:aldo/keto reductase [Asaia astilbis]|uniref:aldo/keto reductase n=1 Tax=Asaia astilbis TaxID=610244 RepID=UPI000470B81D|nr:aldo/keto reductase [Asaia astilbis]
MKTADTITIAGLEKPVKRIALGTWAIGGWMWGGPDDDNAIRTIHRALDHGINFIDTAPVYGFGHSEEVIGRALEGGKRKDVVLATKLGLAWTDEQKVFRDSRPERVRQEVEDSLRRLKTDVIDLEQVHWPDGKTPVEETAHELEKLRKEGKIRAIGVSNFSVQDMDRFGAVTPISTIQPPYNLFERATTERNILPYAEKHNAIVMAYGPLCRGLLAGKMTSETTFSKDDLRSSDPKFQAPNFERYLAAVEGLKAIAARHDKSMLALAIRWILDQGPTVALWGARKPEQIEGIDEALGWHLGDDDKAEIEAILNKHVPDAIEPDFMAPPQRD